MELAVETKRIIKLNKSYLDQNDVNGFFESVTAMLDSQGYAGDVICAELSTICQWFREHDIDVLSHCKGCIPDGIFSYQSITEAIIPESVVEIGCNSFYSCRKLEKVKFPSHLETIDIDAFANCSMIKEIDIPSVSKIAPSAFRDCKNLKRVDLYPGVNIIYGSTFRGCHPDLTIYCHFDPTTVQWINAGNYSFNIERV